MIHDVFDMAARVMELEDAFFLVALDTPTLRAACGAPVSYTHLTLPTILLV